MFSVFNRPIDEPKEIKPLFEKPRRLCPFYGFFLFLNVFYEKEGNFCGIENKPCPMENPCYTCLSKEELLKFSNFKIHPQEFCSRRRKIWGGIPVSKWIEYVTNEKRKRPEI